jgi:hypothetical protein
VPVATADEDGVAVHPGLETTPPCVGNIQMTAPSHVVTPDSTAQHRDARFKSPSDTDVKSHGSTAAGMTTTTPPSASWPHP